ncbi:hypothetical protein F4821DRAFT_180951 [Hypoxylon rubiginosum]|uniref:Uncharacterized protein n=1 Tax=Hypoxylon rubiginosum TaxID=110542 RepID=A0ACC0CU80_9PEZI|nr:hypothetical protein F4821DRAFT_180951 [Hypoxylon rubiginosum]
MDTNYNYTPPDKPILATAIELPVAALLFTALCLIPALTIAIANYWRGRETCAHEALMTGIRMVGLGFGYIVVGVICVPVLGLHYVDKY